MTVGKVAVKGHSVEMESVDEEWRFVQCPDKVTQIACTRGQLRQER